MLSIEERIQLRDELLQILLSSSIVPKPITKNNFVKLYNTNPTLETKLNTYIAEFLSEEEALYCLRHQDDYENHKCLVCGNLCAFCKYKSKKSTNYKYPKVCCDTCQKKRCHSKQANQKRINTNLGKFNATTPAGNPNIVAKMKNTNRNKWGYDCTLQHPDIQAKAEESKLNKYNNKNYNNRAKAAATCEANFGPGKTNPMKVDEIKEAQRKSYMKNHCILDPTIVEECQPILNEIEEGLQLFETYSNAEKLEKFTKLLYTSKERLLKIDEYCTIFDLDNTTIGRRIHELGLEEYFDIPDSDLEVSFMNFLLQNNYQKDIDFKRRLFNLYLDADHRQQLDFLMLKYNIAFEINDTNGHNIATQKNKGKDYSNYHINKTRMAKEQHNIRLIHLWEWELNETNWPKISQWILHIFNQNKIQHNIFNDDNYDIRLVSKEDLTIFLDQYSLDNHRNFDKCIGIYYNNELIEIILFKDNIISICIKFGYDIIVEGTKDIIQYYLQNSSYDHILTYCNLDKFTGKSYEELGFQLLEYQAPFIISELPNESSEYKQLYNCGTNIYVMFKV